jgi:hypothetical protein
LEWVKEWLDERMYGEYSNDIGCIGGYVARQSACYIIIAIVIVIIIELFEHATYYLAAGTHDS